jgi:hypothetical protein
MNAIGARQLFQQIISADAAIGTYARDQAIKLMSDLNPAAAPSTPSDDAFAPSALPLPRRVNTSSAAGRSKDEVCQSLIL